MPLRLINLAKRLLSRPARNPKPLSGRLECETLESREMPAQVYQGVFDWTGLAGTVRVTATVTDDTPGQYLWEYHVENTGFTPAPGQGVGMFIVRSDGADSASGLGGPAGWDGSAGMFLGEPGYVFWSHPEAVSADILVGGSGDFSFTTPVLPIVIWAGEAYDNGFATSAAGQLAVPGAPPPAVSVEDVTNAAEGGADGVFRFTRTGDTSQALTVSYTVEGTATPGADYSALTGSVTFAAGASEAYVVVMALNDTLPEYDETVYLTVQDGVDYTAGPANTAGILVTDNEPPQISVVYLYDALEGGWNGNLGFKRTGDISQPLTVAYTVGGTATPGTDYTPLTGTVTFQAGDVLAVVEVQALTDGISDPNETVTVTAQTGSGYTVDPSQPAGGLVIVEVAPVVQIESAPGSVDEGASGTIVLRRTGGDLSQALTVAVRIGGGTESPATWVTDYVVTGQQSPWSDWGQVTFPANQETLTLSIQARADEESEGDEEVVVELGAGDGTNYALNQVHSATILIRNVTPAGTVPVLADDDKPLSGSQANVLKSHLKALGEGKKLTGPQLEEMKRFLTRLGKYGLETEGEKRLEQLRALVGGLGSVVDRPAAVGLALDFYKEGIGGVLSGLDIARENEYKKFKEQMGGKTGKQAQERYDEIKNGFVAEWIEYHWLRYQAEKIQEKLNSMSP